MHLRIQAASGVPIYLQLVQQIRSLVASRQLAAGAELPAIRTLAERLLINPNTVARAYLELERANIVVKRHGSGTYVAENPPPVARSQQQSILAERVDGLLAEAAQMGIGVEDLVGLLRRRHQRMASPPS
ncbi:MAG: GntR family transcriptional regulator [Verrucomicrobiales bacterium]|nr:GntR family transcriptional regulator [Verrucomicrobiales bacterium]